MANKLQNRRKLTEGIEYGDLSRLIQPVMSIDEFRSKMGDDKDIVVIGFNVFGKEPAEDLVNFVEKSYDWVLDADVSSGETSDGNYMVFIEVQRKSGVSEDLLTMLTDMLNLTEQSLKDWTFTYYKSYERLPVTLENLTEKIIIDPAEYDAMTNPNLGESAMLNQLRAAAGVNVKPKNIRDAQLINLQVAAGIK